MRKKSAETSSERSGRRPTLRRTDGKEWPVRSGVTRAQGQFLFDTLEFGIIFMDEEGIIRSANAAASGLLGIPVADLIGRQFAASSWRLFREDGSPLALTEFPPAAALATGKPVRNAVIGVLPPGARDQRWLRITAVPLEQQARSARRRVYTVLEDITEQHQKVRELRKAHELLEQEAQERVRESAGALEELEDLRSRHERTEEKLRSSEEMFRRFALQAGDLIYLYRLRPERAFEYVSPAATSLTGYTPEELYAEPDLRLQMVHPDDRKILQDRESGDSGGDRPFVLRWVRKDGRIIWTEQRTLPIRDGSGRQVAVQGIARDITDHVRAEEKLRESERFLETIIETEPECVMILARDGTLLTMNRAGLDMLDAGTLSAVQDQSVYGLVVPDFRQDFIRLNEEVFAGKSGTLIFEAVGLQGRRIWLETRSVPLRDEQNEIMASLAITRDITERKRGEETLRNVAEQISVKTGDDYFRAVTKFVVRELGTDISFLGEPIGDGTTIQTIALFADGAYGENFQFAVRGTPCEQVTGRSSCFHPTGVQRIFSGNTRLAAWGIESYAGIPLINSTGSLSGVLVTMGRSPLRPSDQDRIIPLLQIFAGRASAELERRQAGSALRASEQRYRQLLESITSYIYTVTVEKGQAVSTTHGSACLAVTGYRAEEFEADPFLWYRMVREEDKTAVLAQAKVVMAGGRPQPLEHRILHKNGSIIWVRNTTVPRFDASGRLAAYDGIIEDITERKRTEALVKNILETVDEGFIIIDRDMNVVTANRAYLQQLGLELGQAVGRKCYEISHKFDRPCSEYGEVCGVRAVFETGEPQAAIHTHRDADGMPIFVETKAFPLRAESGDVVAAIEIVNNITERKRLEDQLRQAQKMEAVGLLAGGVAHDFNNILTAIVGYGNLLKMKTPADDPRQAYADQILSSAARAANLTQSLLAFSRKQIINPRPLDINEAIRLFEKLLTRVIGEDITLRTEFAPGSITIMADSSQLEQVLMNLAMNARDAMPKGGTLAIRTDTAVIDEEFHRTHGYGISGTYARIEIRDTGVGMDEQTRNHIFEPFYTTKQPGKGTGLGLAIVYGIMKQNKGYITVESAPGAGSVFRLYFPLIAGLEVEKEAADTTAYEEGHETILVAEDDATLREFTTMMLTEFGYTVIQAEDGSDAVRKFREHESEITLAILDVVMPRMDGKEVRDELLKINPAVKVLYVSGYNADILRAKGITEGTANIILKPVSPMDLLHAVRLALDSNDRRRPGKSGVA